MIRNGKIVKSDSGRRIRVDGLIKAGGQGEAYFATETNAKQKGVLKVFHDRYNNDHTRTRIRFLIDKSLKNACSVLEPPVDILDSKTLLGHYTPFVEGQPLEELLRNPTVTFLEQLQVAITLAHSVAAIHSAGIAHGDLHAENIFVNRRGSALRLSIIDFDNFQSPGMPPPPCVGHSLYMAPELRDSLNSGKPSMPSIQTDLFSLGVLMHELLLLIHPANGYDGTESRFNEAMSSGKWLMDPAFSKIHPGAAAGYPATILNANLARLIRAAVEVDGNKRPSATTWKNELDSAFRMVYCCEKCGGPCIIDASKVACPVCERPYPHLTLRLRKGGARITLLTGSMVLGRSELGGSEKISTRHAVFRRIGPETWIESTGRNGTYRWNGTGWIRLPDRRPALIQAGDCLRFGDVEAELSQDGA